MKKLLILVSFAPALLMAQTNGMTLAETRAEVLAGNPSVRESMQRIAAASAVLKQARSAYLPTVSATASYGSIDGSLHPDIDPDHRYTDSFTEASVGLQASLLIFDGFARKARTLSAEYSLQRSQELSEETRRLLISAATVAFRQAQLAKENWQIAEQDRRFNRELEVDARKRFDAGALPESDVYNFSIGSLQAESDALLAQQKHDAACTVLAELMALPQSHLPKEMQPVAITFKTTAEVPRFENEFPFALGHRPDYQALSSGRSAVMEQVNVAKGERLPQVAFVSEINYADRDGYSSSSHHGNYDSFVGLSAKWDLFTGGRKINVVKEARAEMLEIEAQLESLRLAIRSNLRQRIDAAEIEKAIFEREEKILRLAELVRDSIEKSYKAGVASITRLNETQTELIRAKGAHAASFINYQLSLNQLDIETGRVLTE